jgi:hypothetical protein
MEMIVSVKRASLLPPEANYVNKKVLECVPHFLYGKMFVLVFGGNGTSILLLLLLLISLSVDTIEFN